MINTPKRAILYARISDARDEDTHGVDGQLADLRAYAERIGWTPGPGATHVITENDTSAFKRRKINVPGQPVPVLRTVRPGYRRALQMLADGRADGLIAVDLDRVCRDPRDLEDLIDVVESRNPRIPVESRSGSLRLATDADVTMARVMVAVANKSSRDTARRVADSRAKQAAAGLPPGNKRAFGYESDGMTVRRAEADEVASWAERLLADDSLASILRDLRAREVPTVYGGKWSTRTVRDILLRPRNAGIAVYRGEEVGPAQWEPILDEDAWRAVCALLRDEKRRTSPGNTVTWLGSLIYLCGVCGNGETVSMAGPRKRTLGPTYNCRAHGHLRRIAAPVDDMVTKAIIGRLSMPDAAAKLAPARGKDTSALVREATALRVRINEAGDLWESGEWTKAEYTARSGRLRERLAAVEAEFEAEAGDGLTSLVGKLAGRPDIEERWHALSIAQRRELVRGLLVVTILPGRPGRTAGGGYFDPSTVRIEWAR